MLDKRRIMQKVKIKDVLSPSFRDFQRPLKPMVVVAHDSDFCQEVVAKGWLTKEQMAHAAARYRLGKSNSGKCIFWMIDELGQVRDGRLGTSWVSVMLKAREPELLRGWYAKHCLFGLHLLKPAATVCVVEAERSAVVLSELFPEHLWMAVMEDTYFTLDLLEPLQANRVVIYPHTDMTQDNFLCWEEMADEARRTYQLDITVSDVLEKHASQEQKQRSIDLLRYLEVRGER